MTSEPRQKKRVFIADDHVISREAVVFLLERTDRYEVVGQCGDGLQAIEQVVTTNPDMAILNVQMPGLNGIDACRDILRRKPSLPVLMFTMHDDEECIIRALECGARGYLLKESDEAALIEAVDAVSAGKMYLGPGIDPGILNRLHKPKADPYETLTSREREVLQLITEGLTNRRIAERLRLGVRIVDTHRMRLMRKLGIHDQTTLVRFAFQRGIGVDTGEKVAEPPGPTAASGPRSDAHDKLTEREQKVLGLIVAGKPNREGAVLLGVSVKTFDTHRVRAMRKLGIHDTRQLLRFFWEPTGRSNGSVVPKEEKKAPEAAIPSAGIKTPIDPHDALTLPERQVLRLVAVGLTNRQIAERLGLSLSMTSARRARLMKKLGIHTQTALIKFAHGRGIGVAKYLADAIEKCFVADKVTRCDAGIRILHYSEMSGVGGQGRKPEEQAERVEQYRRAAEAGSIYGMNNFGLCCITGRCVTQDTVGGIEWLRKAAAGDNPDAMFNLGSLYDTGHLVPRDLARAAKWLRKAANSWHTLAMYHLGAYYDEGKGVRKDHAEAMRWYRQAADAGNPEAMYRLGLHYSRGEGVQQDYAAAVDWFVKGAEAGGGEDLCVLGYMYMEGRHVPQNDAEAARWFRKAAGAGDAVAMASLGFMHESGRGVPQDGDEADKWFRMAGEAGGADGMNSRGVQYSEGAGVTQDHVMALRWFRKAAEAGSVEGMFNVGLCYGKGVGVERDCAEAARWYQKSAGAGDSDAMYNLAVYYSNGTGVPRDDAKAAKWFLKAAKAGDADAVYVLGRWCASGRQVTQDYTKAVKLFCKAAACGNDEAKAALKKIAEGPGPSGRAGGTVRKSKRAALAKLKREGKKRTAKNRVEMVEQLCRAAKCGSAEAMLGIAGCYATGQGLPKDAAEAARWYRNAAKAGNTDAMVFLGDCYADGEGVPQDDPEAMKWFHKAANAGSPDAMYVIGLWCARGRVVAQDYIEAVKWFCKAAAKGSDEAERTLKRLGQK